MCTQGPPRRRPGCTPGHADADEATRRTTAAALGGGYIPAMPTAPAPLPSAPAVRAAALALVIAAACADPSRGPEAPAGDPGAPELVVANARVYTGTEARPYASALAVRGGRLVAVGDDDEVAALAGAGTRVVDLGGRFAMPGFIEGHAHFGGLGEQEQNLDLLATRSWREIVDSVRARAARARPGEWIYGRGWHQEKWTDAAGLETVDGYPLHDELSAASPDNPVVLTHASGHGAYANARAMAAAGITAETVDPAGGRIVRDAEGRPVGAFEERATARLYAALNAYYESLPPAERERRRREAWRLAERAALAAGITTFQDAGTRRADLDALRVLAEADSLSLRLWMMVRESCEELAGGSLEGLPWIGLGRDRLTVRAIKTELDGALGSYGAWLLDDYADKPGFRGQNTTAEAEVRCIADLAFARGMQLCVHAIGDRANRLTLDVAADYAARVDTPLRWRDEHAQHLHPDDLPRFAATGTIASMQAIHATSDAPFVVARLGERRAREGAYAWRALLDAGAVVTNGTDAPVEPVSALASLYAMVARRRPGQTEAFFPGQALSREEAIAAYTIAPAYAAFEERDKGTLEVGKLADFVVLDRDLLACPVDSIPAARVEETWVGGERVWTAPPPGARR